MSDDFTAKGLEMLREAGFSVADIHPAAVRADTDDSRERVVARTVDSALRCETCGERCTSGLALREHTIREHEARPAEPTGGLREQVALETAGHGLAIGVNQRLVLCTCGWRNESDDNLARPLRNWALHIADALLSGPLAPLLAKLRAVEALVDSWEALACEYDGAAAAVTTPSLIAEAQGHAEDIRASVGGLRRALDAS